MAVFAWTGQNRNTPTGDVVIGDGTHKLGLYGAAFNDPIQITTGVNASSHVENTANADQCTTPHLNNTAYLGAALIDINGAGSEDIANLLTTECPLKIHFNHTSSVTTSAATFFCYDGTTESTAPTDVTVYACEQGDAAWSGVGGSGNTLSLADNTTAEDHYFYLGFSVIPTAVGVKTNFKMKFQLTYA